MHDDVEVGFVDYKDWLGGPAGHSYGRITGRKFNDIDGDCIIDPDELGLRGWIIQSLPVNLYTTTDEYGNYSFNYLPAGNYTIKEIMKEYWQQTCPSYPECIQIKSFGMTLGNFA